MEYHFINRTKSHFYSEFGLHNDELGSSERLQQRAARFSCGVKNNTGSTLGSQITQRRKKPLSLVTTVNNMSIFEDLTGDIDWSEFHVVGTCQDLEKPYLRLTSVSAYCLHVSSNVYVRFQLNLVLGDLHWRLLVYLYLGSYEPMWCWENMPWGCLCTVQWEEFLILRGKKWWETGENCIFMGLVNHRKQIKWCGLVVVKKRIHFLFLMCTYLLSGPWCISSSSPRSFKKFDKKSERSLVGNSGLSLCLRSDEIH